MFLSKIEKEKIQKNEKIYRIFWFASTLLAISCFIGAFVTLDKYTSAILYFGLMGLVLIFGIVGVWILSSSNTIVYTKDEMDTYMIYFCKLYFDVKDYVTDEEKQTVFLKKKNSVIEEVSIDYIVEKAEFLKEKEEEEAKQIQVYQGDFDKLKEVKEKKNPEIKSIDEEIFNTLKEKAKVKENTINKKSKKVYL